MLSRSLTLRKPVSPIAAPRGFWMTVCRGGVAVSRAGLGLFDAAERAR